MSHVNLEFIRSLYRSGDLNLYDSQPEIFTVKQQKRLDKAVGDLNELRKLSGVTCFACKHEYDYDRNVCGGCPYNDYNNWSWKDDIE